jgi:signal transduction histidine kinase
MKLIIAKPVQIFLIAIVVSLSAIYGLCDYYLQSVGHELMMNWVRSESALIQEGNLLTSSSKNQRFLLSSDYIQAIKLIRFSDNQISERLHFGNSFELQSYDIPELNSEITLKRVGFLHSRAFYQIPSRKEMIMVFDIESKVLNSVFFGGAIFLLLMVIGLVATIRFIEEQEFKKREELFKQALNDFISKDKPSKMVEKALPTLMSWWKDKKDQVALANELAIKNQSKIALGEIAARVGHDIIGSVRNAEILSKRALWSNEKQKDLFSESLIKIKSIVGEISQHTREQTNTTIKTAEACEPFDLVSELKRITHQKQIQFEGQFNISFDSHIFQKCLNVAFDCLELERSVSNLINNAVEASSLGSAIAVKLKTDSEFINIEIVDTGKGIPEDMISKVGTKNFTSGKENGTGIGVFYSRQFVEGLGGQLKISSTVQKGTTVSLLIPKSHVVSDHEIQIQKNQHLLILEDKKMNQMAIQIKFNRVGIADSDYTIFSTPSELEQWLSTNKTDYKLYSDYYLETESGEKLETGTQVIKRLGLNQKSILFTSAHAEPTIIQAANEVGVKVLSKDQFFDAEVRMM